MAHETALAHAAGLGQRGDREVAGQMIRDPGMQAFEALVAVLQRERRAELRLPARRFRNTTSWRATARASA
jgi:hypothetical protein